MKTGLKKNLKKNIGIFEWFFDYLLQELLSAFFLKYHFELCRVQLYEQNICQNCSRAELPSILSKAKYEVKRAILWFAKLQE